MERVNTITSPKSIPIGKCEDFSLKSSTSIKHYLRNKASSSLCRGVPSFTSWTTRGRRRFVRMVTSVTSAVSPVWIPLLLTSSLCHHRFVILEKPTALKLCGGRNGNRKTPEHQSCETSGKLLAPPDPFSPPSWESAVGHSQRSRGSRAALGLGDPQAAVAHCICSLHPAAQQLPATQPREPLHGVGRVQAVIAAAGPETALKLGNGKEERSFKSVVQLYGK